MRTLDSIEGWILTPEQVSRYHNDISTIEVIWFGLEHLYATIRQCEEISSKEFLPLPVPTFRLAQSGPEHALVRCVFDWYAVSACNLVRLIGWVASDMGATSESNREYLKRILPAVKVYRDKFAAHFSRHSPEGDSSAVQMASTMFFSIVQINGRYAANKVTLSTQHGGISSDSSPLLSWSVVETHMSLRQRYKIDFSMAGVEGVSFGGSESLELTQDPLDQQ